MSVVGSVVESEEEEEEESTTSKLTQSRLLYVYRDSVERMGEDMHARRNSLLTRLQERYVTRERGVTYDRISIINSWGRSSSWGPVTTRAFLRGE